MLAQEHNDAQSARITELEAINAGLRTELAKANAALTDLRQRYFQTIEQLALIKRRMYLAKAERLDTASEQLAFDLLMQEAKALKAAIDAASNPSDTPETEPNEDNKANDNKDDEKKKRNNNSTGRRKLDESNLPIIRIEITDSELEGKAERIGFQDSWRLGYEQGGHRRIQIARAVYKVEGPATQATEPAEPKAATREERELQEVLESVAPEADMPHEPLQQGNASCHIVVAPKPLELLRRGLLAPTMIAFILIQKFVMGLPCFRLERSFRHQSVPLSRGLMYRYIEHIGATLGCIVEACRKEAIAHAFCLSTDATGVLVQPEPREDGRRQPCCKGHFFVTLADKDFVFFDYVPRHTSVAVWNLFNGFHGFIQADANAVYDALFNGKIPKPRHGVEPTALTGPPPKEVGCWAHARRPFWEAAVCKHRVGLVGLLKIKEIYEADAVYSDVAPAQRKLGRDKTVLPLVDAFFVWVEQERAKVTERGLVATALGYSHNQEAVLRAFFADGRLRLDNNHTESAIRPVCTGRKAWLFFGSDDNACSAANVMSLAACCQLHDLDPARYFPEVIHVLPYWPRDRYLELAPLHWKATRARLDPRELARELGPITVPPPMPDAPQKQEGPSPATSNHCVTA